MRRQHLAQAPGRDPARNQGRGQEPQLVQERGARRRARDRPPVGARLDEGLAVAQETRGFDADSGRTRSLRGKEAAHDYRYFPEPDLPVLHLSHQRASRRSAGGASRDAVAAPGAARRQRTDSARPRPATWSRCASSPTISRPSSPLRQACRERPRTGFATTSRGSSRNDSVGLEEAIAPVRLAEILTLVENGELSSGAPAKCCARSGRPPKPPALRWIVSASARSATNRSSAGWVNEVLSESPQQAAQFRAGKTQVLGYLVGQVMKRSAGRADPRRVQELLREALLEEPNPAN